MAIAIEDPHWISTMSSIRVKPSSFWRRCWSLLSTSVLSRVGSSSSHLSWGVPAPRGPSAAEMYMVTGCGGHGSPEDRAACSGGFGSKL